MSGLMASAASALLEHHSVESRHEDLTIAKMMAHASCEAKPLK
jgi:hypothetical protein